MANRPFTLENWQNTGDYVLAVLVGEPLAENTDRHFWSGVEAGLTASDFPAGKWRDTFTAIADLILEKQPVHLTTLQARIPADLTQYHAQLYAVYGNAGQSTLRGDVFAANVTELRRLAQVDKDMRLLNSAAGKLSAGEDRNAVVSIAMTGLAQSDAGQMRGETAVASAVDFRAHMDSTAQLDFLSGVALIDEWLEGFYLSNLIVIAAAMKQRKTSLLLNIMLNMVRRQGMSVCLLMFESTRQMVVAQCVSMLAIEWLIRQQIYTLPVQEGSNILHRYISPDTLVKLRGRYRAWKDLRVDAVDNAIRLWADIGQRFRIYDRTPEGGGLDDCNSITRITTRDRMLYGTQFVGIDHAQRINEPGSEYERLTRIAPYCEKLARRENLAVCLLAQLTAENAARQGQNDAYTSGIRGGTVLDEACDYLLTTSYRLPVNGRPMADNKLVIQLKHSRYGNAGASMRGVVDIDPYTGYILDGGQGESMAAYEAAF